MSFPGNEEPRKIVSFDTVGESSAKLDQNTHVSTRPSPAANLTARTSAHRAGDVAHAQAALISYAAGRDPLRDYLDRCGSDHRRCKPLLCRPCGQLWRQRLSGDAFSHSNQPRATGEAA